MPTSADEFGSVDQFLLRVEFPRAADYVVSLDFMHNVDGLLRYASVTNVIRASDDSPGADGGDGDAPEPWLPWSRNETLRFRLLDFESASSYAHMQLPRPVGDADDAAAVTLLIERYESLVADSCRLVTLGVGRRAELHAFLQAPVHFAVFLADVPVGACAATRTHPTPTHAAR